MISKELKNLSRRELIDIIYQMKRNEQQMQEEIAQLRAQLEDRRIRLEQAGSVAEAAAAVSDLLASAQMTADLYLGEIECMKKEAKISCERMIEEARKTAEKMLSAGAK